MTRKIKQPGKTAHLFAYAADLRARPGEWQPFPYPVTARHSAASRIRNGHMPTFGSGFEARVTSTGLHVRYAPQENAA